MICCRSLGLFTAQTDFRIRLEPILKVILSSSERLKNTIPSVRETRASSSRADSRGIPSFLYLRLRASSESQPLVFPVRPSSDCRQNISFNHSPIRELGRDSQRKVYASIDARTEIFLRFHNSSLLSHCYLECSRALTSSSLVAAPSCRTPLT